VEAQNALGIARRIQNHAAGDRAHLVQAVFERGGHAEVAATGLSHGFLYRPLPNWLDPVAKWAEAP
jgi:hypothetical protein